MTVLITFPLPFTELTSIGSEREAIKETVGPIIIMNTALRADCCLFQIINRFHFDVIVARKPTSTSLQQLACFPTTEYTVSSQTIRSDCTYELKLGQFSDRR